MALELDIPTREPPSRGGFPARRRGVRAWLRELAGLDRRERSRRLYEGIHALNRIEIPPRRRLAILEDLRPTAREVLDYLASRIQSQALPLPERAQHIHNLNVDLLRELATGYACVLSAEGSRGRRGRLATAIERTLALHGEWMLRAAQIYSRVPESYWQTVNAVYDLAEQAGVTRRAVADPELGTNGPQRATPVAVYRRILLFALAGTQGLRRGEAERIHRELIHWGEDAHLGTDEGAVSGGTCFAVDLTRAIGPAPLGTFTVAPESRLRVLQVDPLADRIERLYRESPPEDSPIAQERRVGSAALRRLLDSWRPANHERSERAQRGEEVDAEVTLSVIVARLSAEVMPEEEQPRKRRRVESAGASLTLQTIEGPEQSPGGSAAADRSAGAEWGEVEVGQHRSTAYNAARRAEARLDREGNLPEHPRWLLQDVSATGYRLWWDADGSSRAAVGELAALRLAEGANNAGRWSVGVVRRMQFLDERRFEIGVHALSRQAVPARVRREPSNPNRKRDRRNEPSEPALMLPASERLGVPTTVLVPAHMFRMGEILELELPERMLRIRLAGIRENTGSFSQYELEPAPSRGRHARPRSDESSDPRQSD